MLNIFCSPLQGYTDFVWRRIHHELAGGVQAYYTPFLRMEGGTIRPRDVRDVAPENNRDVPVIPQIIVSGRDEFCFLTDHLIRQGYEQADINMGCSFPLQTKLYRGAGMLPYPTRVEELMQAVAERASQIRCSVKLRLGMDAAGECLVLLPILNEAPLSQIAVHARTGRMQFRGQPDMETFARFAEGCRHPLLFNGDIASCDDLHQLEKDFPKLSGVLIGRGLLARPTLAREYIEGTTCTEAELLTLILKMHEQLFAHARESLQGASQVLSRMQAFWEYQLPSIPKKTYKKLMKAGTLITYEEALHELVSYTETLSQKE